MDLAFSSTIDLAAAIAARKISAVEALDAHLTQIDRHSEAVNAVVNLDREGARERAKQADAVQARGDALGPLHGVPFTLKDMHQTADMKTTVGFAPFADYVAKADSPVVARLKAAGGILIGKTNVATMLGDWQSDNPLFGRTSNPWNRSRTSGGSSGGAAAAVATGMTPFDVGTDMQDSIRLPSAFCGVYGFKPTHGLIPRSGVLSLSRTLDHVGVFGRSIEDIALLTEELVGYHEDDPDTRPRARIPFRAIAAEAPPIEPMFAFIKTPHWEKASEDMKLAFGELVQTLGDRVEEVELSASASEAWAWHKTIMEADMAASFEKEWETGRDKLSPQLRSLIERGREVHAVDYQRALRGIAPLVAGFEDLFIERYDAILTPAAPGSAPKGLGSTGDPAFCSLWSLTGMPEVTLPVLQDSAGLPIGAQLVGRRLFDARLLRAASWLRDRVEAQA